MSVAECLSLTHSSFAARTLCFVQDADAITSAFSELREAVGPMPLTEASSAAADGKEGAGGEEAAESGASTTVTKNIVLSDGTYATQTTVVGACLLMRPNICHVLRWLLVLGFCSARGGVEGGGWGGEGGRLRAARRAGQASWFCAVAVNGGSLSCCRFG